MGGALGNAPVVEGATRALSPRFRIVSRVASGGSGVVYEAFDTERRERVALKTLRAPTPDTLLLLKNEFRRVQDVQHPNLVTLHELLEAQGQWFISMEFVEGETLLSYVRPRKADGSPGETLDVGRLRAAFGQLAAGLVALHEAHKVHRDIKPSNVLVTPAGRVIVLDFGIAAELTSGGQSTDVLAGSPPYMAPEQAADEPIGPAADWYAVGTVLFEALTGRLPFEGKTYEILSAKMAEEAPSPRALAPDAPDDLLSLCEELLRLEPGDRPEGPEILRRLGVARTEASRGLTDGMLVGRSHELEVLRDAYDTMVSGETLTVVVQGESGVGKSLLVRELTRRLEEEPEALILRGRCYERESVRYKGVDSLVDDLAQFLAAQPDETIVDLLPENVGLLRRVFPVLDVVPQVAEARASAVELANPQELRAVVFSVLRALLTRVARTRHLVLLVDDLQWADADGLALLSELVRPPHAPRLLLLATLRTGTDVRRRGAGWSHPSEQLPGTVRTLDLAPLSAEDARELAVRLLGATGGDARTNSIEHILAEGKGHPLFIDELVRHRIAVGGASAPARLDDALWNRACRLPSPARALLEAVAVAGAPLPLEAAARATSKDLGEVFSLVAVLRAANFVKTTGVYRSDTLDAYHDRIRESVLGHLDASTRATWHGRLALALEQSRDAEAEALMVHWAGAGNGERACQYAIEAADKAVAALAFDHAASLYRRALEHEGLSAVERKTLLVKLGEALTNAGRGGEGATAYLEAAEGDVSRAGVDLRRRAAEELMCSGHIDRGAATLDAVLAAVGLRAPTSTALVLVSLLVSSIVLAVRGLRYVPRPAEAIDPKELLRIDCLHSAGAGLGMTDHIRGKEFQLRTLLLALRTGEPTRVARSLAFYTASCASAGGPAYERTQKLLAVVRGLAVELRNPYTTAMAAVAAAYTYQFTGQWRKAKAEFLDAERILREQCVGVTFEINSVRTLLCRVLMNLGELDELSHRTSAIVRDAVAKGDLYTAMNVRGMTSFVELARGDVAAAQNEVDLAKKELPAQGFFVQHYFWMLGQVFVDLYDGRPERARQLLDEKASGLKRSLLLKVQPMRALIADVHARAAIGCALRDEGARESWLRDAEKRIRALEAEAMPWLTPQARFLAAAVASARGQRTEAAALLAEAAEGLAAADMQLAAAAARYHRGRLLGAEGAAEAEQAEAWMRSAGVASPARMAGLFAPFENG